MSDSIMEMDILSRAGLSKIYLHSRRHDGPHNTFTEPENAISAEKNAPKVYLNYAELAKIWNVGKRLLVSEYCNESGVETDEFRDPHELHEADELHDQHEVHAPHEVQSN
ncbi:hypothetical protein G6F68_012837 [Rhizopus microsporus]|nr:hypothetical protein G6F68_012837 [Rhizopus microsporus]